MLECIDVNVVNNLTRKYSKYKNESLESNKHVLEALLDEHRKLSFDISRFLGESDNVEAYEASLDYLDTIKKQIINRKYDDAKVNITILEILLGMDIYFYSTLPEIKNMVSKEPITFNNLNKKRVTEMAGVGRC